MITKILILRFGAIGDIVHSTALFRSIKRKHPHISIHYACFRGPSLNIQNDPDLDKVWIAEGKSYKQLWQLAKQLRQENFNLFINLQPGIRTRLFSLMLGAPKTVTYRKTFKLHAVENFWQTGKKIIKDIELEAELHLYPDENIKNRLSATLNSKKPLIAFNMGVSPTRQGRRWPQYHWRELAKRFLEEYDCEILLTGSHEDREFSENLLDLSSRIKSFCGKLTIDENTALLSLCNLVISGDTGPLHIATAVKTPAIGLYGAAPISRTGPYGKNCTALHSDMECVPCNRRKCRFLNKDEIYTPCMTDIKPSLVMEKAKSLKLA